MNLLRNDEGNLICNQDAAECAKLLVDEIIESSPLEPTEDKKYYETLGDRQDDAIKYWHKVKKELKKY